MASRKAAASAANIPLRLRKRRDGTLALVDADGRVNGQDRAFPAEHVFTATTALNLAGAGALTLAGDTLTVELCNAKATYKVTESRANGELVATLESASVSNAPDIDEKAAATLAAQREEV